MTLLAGRCTLGGGIKSWGLTLTRRYNFVISDVVTFSFYTYDFQDLYRMIRTTFLMQSPLIVS